MPIMALLNINSRHLAFSDGDTVSNNPTKKYFDFLTNFNGIRVSRPHSDEDTIPPSGSVTLFSGTRALTLDGTTVMALTLSPAYPSVYRLAATGGQAPGFRTSRTLTLNGQLINVTINNNSTVDFALAEASGQNFATVQVGDALFIPGPSTGDADTVFNPSNEGFWTVLAVGPVGAAANHKITVKRQAGQTFQAESESVTLTAATQMQVFSSSGVQVGDRVRISAGFSTVSRKTYQVTNVTASWVEFFSSDPLPLESGRSPGASGISVYSEARNFVRILADQAASVQLNGGGSVPITPRLSGDPDQPGWLDVWGTFWEIILINESTSSELNYKLLTATEST